jgi:hypothetical protein
VERPSGACQGYMGSLPRADCALDGAMHGCSVSFAGEGGEEPEPTSSFDTASSGRPPSPESSVALFAH